VALGSTVSTIETPRVIALLGQHNVGKSVLFHRLTGRYATVSNYAGTTVEVSRGMAHRLAGATVVDTPGILTLPSRTEDEQATVDVLLREPLSTIVQVGDAKNLRRVLPLTLQLAETGVPLVLALNMMDEAADRGIGVDHTRLQERLGLPVVPTVATQGRGVDVLAAVLASVRPSSSRLSYPEEIEATVAELEPLLPPATIAPRAVALLWLCRDPAVERWLEDRVTPTVARRLQERRTQAQMAFVEPMSVVVQRARQAEADRLTSLVATEAYGGWAGMGARLGRLAVHPLWGLPLLAAVLYALYWFVGVFGAGTLVGWLEEHLFGEIVNPWVVEVATGLIPVKWIAAFIAGEYGLWTMGMTYALALILPIVTTFFLAFGVLEDTGYLPRLSVLTNRVFSLLGLNGRAVLPMVLGLGCVTMATMTTRILESRRDRLLVILLLALAVPCSAQLGVVMGMLAGVSFAATTIWSAVVVAVLVTVGALAARLVPGERSPLLVELPPLRRPVPANVVIKTAARVEWYLKEVVPLFLVGTALLFGLDAAGVLPRLVRAGEPLVTGWLGLPREASMAFLMGFLRRDFGASGLFTMQAQGALTPVQVVVAMVTITLFIPCVASVFMIARERSTRTAMAMVVVVFPLAFLVGGLLYRLLTIAGWGV
jgi:ferrous iron transport protein B